LADFSDVIGGAAIIVSLICEGIQIRRNAKSSQSAHESLANVILEMAKDTDLSIFCLRELLHLMNCQTMSSFYLYFY
jgi:hypothetical protein